MSKKRLILATVSVILLCITGFFAMKGLFKNRAGGSVAGFMEAGLTVGEDEQTMSAWVPYVIDDAPDFILGGYLYSAGTIETAVTGEWNDDSRSDSDRSRGDGLPANFPDNIFEAYKLVNIHESESSSDSCWVQFDSSATYQETVNYYRDAMNDKSDFSEAKDDEDIVYFRCLVPDWELFVMVVNCEDGRTYVEIKCLGN